ncbi:hypothetical protein [Chelatococcus reniformis]|uniref:Uncharacterized protein n=1 Tax=Chelatococcus reniformis TaxID=1494448 RepID=A0A916UNL3_9HYPH|nr:hypothetical protein [Chelatococcus reniformis]GGC79370.1 hypothetical protein GCM10010994_41810 [Chelatococcus reniformis]
MRIEAEAREGTGGASKDTGPVPAGEFTVGFDRFDPDEALAHGVRVDGLTIDRASPSNAHFRQITGSVAPTGRKPRVEGLPGAVPCMLRGHSSVASLPRRAVDMRDRRMVELQAAARACATGRYVDEPHRFPTRQAGATLSMSRGDYPCQGATCVDVPPFERRTEERSCWLPRL